MSDTLCGKSVLHTLDFFLFSWWVSDLHFSCYGRWNLFITNSWETEQKSETLWIIRSRI